MTVKTRAELATDIGAKLADNTSGDISPQDVREVATDLKDSALFSGDALSVLAEDGSAVKMTPAERTKLTGIETGATADQTGTEIVAAIDTELGGTTWQGGGAGVLNNYVATAAPTVNDDSGDGYAVGSEWIDVTNDQAYQCVDASVGAAVWLPVGFTASDPGDLDVATFAEADNIIVGDGTGVKAATLTGTASSSTYLRGDGAWSTPAGSGNVSKVGTPVANRLAYWTGDGTLGHEAGFEYDAATDTATVTKITIGGVTFDGADQLTAPGSSSLMGYSTTAATTVYFTPFQAIEILVPGMASVSLTDGATITPDFGAARNFHVTLGGNRTLANPTNQVAGQSGRILVTQDGTGSRTLAYGANWRFFGSAVLTTTAGAVDLILYDVHASGTIYASLIKNAVIP